MKYSLLFISLLKGTVIALMFIFWVALFVSYFATVFWLATWWLLGGWSAAGFYFLLAIFVPLVVCITIHEINT